MAGGDYREGCVAATNMGRDADTVTNLVGALCGAMHGVHCIPGEWREGVQECAPAIYGRFEEIAGQFAAMIEKKAENYATIANTLKSLNRA
jgi:ADP-ribosylglycohydrolase